MSNSTDETFSVEIFETATYTPLPPQCLSTFSTPQAAKTVLYDITVTLRTSRFLKIDMTKKGSQYASRSKEKTSHFSVETVVLLYVSLLLNFQSKFFKGYSDLKEISSACNFFFAFFVPFIMLHYNFCACVKSGSKMVL